MLLLPKNDPIITDLRPHKTSSADGVTPQKQPIIADLRPYKTSSANGVTP